jgi:phosphoribosylanthranilate isomerase
MTVAVKICGINDPVAMQAALNAGAEFVGLVFYPRSPRFVTVEQAQKLVSTVPPDITSVGLFVDPTDDELLNVGRQVMLHMVQLHGSETPKRVAEIKKLTGMPVMKAIKIEAEADFAQVAAYEQVADWLLFDAKPADSVNALPGGNAVAFDWSLMKDRNITKPWMLAGGLNVTNIAEAVRLTGASVIDVSSGVEDAPGKKNPDKIHALITLAMKL